jgi:hypothetical protein
MRIVLASATVAQYPNGGGHWHWRLQYPLGLLALGHDVLWLEVLRASGDRARDLNLVGSFLERTAKYDLRNRAVVALARDTPLGNLAQAEIYGATREEIARLIREADLVWNFWYGLKAPLLSEFRRRVFLDVDPGHFHVCAASFPELEIDDHDAYLTVGLKINDADCGIPLLGRKWHSFRPFSFAPANKAETNPGMEAAFTSITHWTWEELHFNRRVLSVSKRAAYLNFAELPLRTKRQFELAANLPPGDEPLFHSNGWRLVDPNRIAASPEQYLDYIHQSRAEFMCPKPIHVDLKTGWFSDRSATYLSSGRPVLAQDTGFSEKLPTGLGIVTFNNLEEAAAGVADIDADYDRHRRAASELAEQLFSPRKCLEEMLSASFS